MKLTTEGWPDPAMAYTLFVTPGGPPMGGMTVLTDELKAMGAPPHWSGVVKVADVDALVAKAVAMGGSAASGPFDVPGVGRYALLADPQGAMVGLMQSSSPEEGPSVTPGDLGSVAWNELWTSDPDAAIAFYGALFGWQPAGSMDMGPELGTYHMLAPAGSSEPAVGVAKLMAGQTHSAWLYYLSVASTDAAVAEVVTRGGKVIIPLMDVPGGGRAAGFLDPQGAAFGLVSRG